MCLNFYTLEYFLGRSRSSAPHSRLPKHYPAYALQQKLGNVTIYQTFYTQKLCGIGESSMGLADPIQMVTKWYPGANILAHSLMPKTH